MKLNVTMKKLLTLLVFFGAALQVGYAQTDTIAKLDDDAISLEDLMKVKVTVASRNEQTLRETPGVVTIVTAEEIRNSGARDLIDILRLVPGFDFAQDVDGIIGLGIRGNWAQEAKVLFKIDGVDVVETSYGSLQFGTHYPVGNIERIEIIRGPGSTIYGGNASLAVINIITRDGKKINGIGASATYGQLQNTFGRALFSVGAGKEFKNGLDFSVNLYGGAANMSDRTLLDTAGFVNFADSSRVRPLMLNTGIKYKGLDIRYIFDNYTQQLPSQNNTFKFQSHLGAVSYNLKVNDKFSIIPRIAFKRQLPWFYTNKADTAAYNSNVKTARYDGSIQLDYKPIDKLEILAGGEYFHDYASVYADYSDFRFNGNKKSVQYYNIAAFAQVQYFSKWVNLTAGIRYDKHNRFGGVFVPRLVLTKLMGKFHGKLMASRAFRAPMIFNMDVNPNIKPEYVTVYEAELGMMITDNMFATFNFYYNNVQDPIIYTADNGIEGYYNGAHMGSKGFEFEYRYKSAWGYINTNYSFYMTTNKNELNYLVPNVPNLALAFPAHKVTINSNLKLYKSLSFSPVFVFNSTRYAFNSTENLIKFDPVFLLSGYFNYDNIFKGFSAGIGVFDILGQNYKFAQAYRSFYNPMPGPGRELVIRLRYKFSFPN